MIGDCSTLVEHTWVQSLPPNFMTISSKQKRATEKDELSLQTHVSLGGFRRSLRGTGLPGLSGPTGDKSRTSQYPREAARPDGGQPSYSVTGLSAAWCKWLLIRSCWLCGKWGRACEGRALSAGAGSVGRGCPKGTLAAEGGSWEPGNRIPDR